MTRYKRCKRITIKNISFRIWLAAGQTTTAIVTAFIPPNTDIGATDKITFTSQGLGLASQAATLTVISSNSVQVNQKSSYKPEDNNTFFSILFSLSRTPAHQICTGRLEVVVKVN